MNPDPVRVRARAIPALLVLASATTLFAQPVSYQDLAPALAAKIAAATAGGERIAIASAFVDSAEEAQVRQVEREVARLLSARGLRIDALVTAPAMITVAARRSCARRGGVAEYGEGPFTPVRAGGGPDLFAPAPRGGSPAD